MFVADAEINGAVNSAANIVGNSQFKLILATLEQDLLKRFRLAENIDDKNSGQHTEALTSLYPEQRLSVTEETWVNTTKTKKYIEAEALESARLWQIMHPDPLSLYDDPKRLDEVVVANSSYHTQSNLNADSASIEQQSQSNEQDLLLEQDPTMLYEILTELDSSAA
jgi:hypothetical protein